MGKGMGIVKKRRERATKGVLWTHYDQLGIEPAEDSMRTHVKHVSQCPTEGHGC